EPRPLYVRIADGIREAIKREEYRVGDKLPSYTQLAEQYDASPMTVKQAINSLKSDGTVVGRQGLGVFVRTVGGAPIGDHSAVEDLVARVDQLEARVQAIESRDGQPDQQ
ncbi:MAG: GntR family transcriptional regulator, partial [Nocardioides sp.]